MYFFDAVIYSYFELNCASDNNVFRERENGRISVVRGTPQLQFELPKVLVNVTVIPFWADFSEYS